MAETGSSVRRCIHQLTHTHQRDPGNCTVRPRNACSLQALPAAASPRLHHTQALSTALCRQRCTVEPNVSTSNPCQWQHPHSSRPWLGSIQAAAACYWKTLCQRLPVEVQPREVLRLGLDVRLDVRLGVRLDALLPMAWAGVGPSSWGILP